MNEINNIRGRNIKNVVFRIIVTGLALLCSIPLLLILYNIVIQGIGIINLDFFWNLPKPVGETGGGIFNAIIGTLMLILVAIVVAVPIGVAAGIYLFENKNRGLAKVVRLGAEILHGIPSIVIGIIVYLWIVKPFGGFSAFSGGIALSIIMLPVIIRTTEETLNMIPKSLKEASLALGVPYSRTIRKVIIPCAISGIVNGITLSVARVMGETAPLLFTAFGNPYLNYDFSQPVDSLPQLIYTHAISPYEDWHQQAWGAALILVVMIFVLSIFTKLIIRKWKVQL